MTPASDEKAHDLTMQQRLPARRVGAEQADSGEQQEGAHEGHVESRETGAKAGQVHPITWRPRR